jgi:hypothetical protein
MADSEAARPADVSAAKSEAGDGAVEAPELWDLDALRGQWVKALTAATDGYLRSPVFLGFMQQMLHGAAAGGSGQHAVAAPGPPAERDSDS